MKVLEKKTLPIAKREAPKVSGLYSRSFRFKKVKEGVWRFLNAAPYASAVEEGVKPFIYKNGATIVSFPWGFRSMERHPGSEGQNVLKRALRKALRSF